MEQQFINCGYTTVKNNEKADIYVVNTCTVTNVAERKSRQMLRRVKEINNEAILVVCGCYAQVAKKELEEIQEIDIILGINEKNNIVEIVEKYMAEIPKAEKKKLENVEDVSNQKEFLDFGDVTYTEKNRAVVKVQDGCNMFCTYCAIPYARGRIRSRKIESVVSEITKIAKTGIKEVVITGIHVASYGKDFDGLQEKKIRLIDLLEAINKIEGIQRIRLSSLEPTIIDEEFVKRLVKLEKICDHFHLSLQSGCNETLKRMNRKYTTERYKEAVDLLRKYYPNVNFTTDVIVGFPGETEEEFEKTRAYLEKINLYEMHIFKYSVREGTRAQKMSGHVPEQVKTERSEVLLSMAKRHKTAFEEWYVGRKEKVLLEEIVEKNGKKYFQGYTAHYVKVAVELTENDTKLEQNEVIVVDIQGFIDENLLYGKVSIEF